MWQQFGACGPQTAALKRGVAPPVTTAVFLLAVDIVAALKPTRRLPLRKTKYLCAKQQSLG